MNIFYLYYSHSLEFIVASLFALLIHFTFLLALHFFLSLSTFLFSPIPIILYLYFFFFSSPLLTIFLDFPR
ncbi:unnamed protein product [Penicillium olsonii]|nr:unnamed protein product [Penicillium olsonii]